ncbi:MAG: hypothetical protein H0X43_07605 [Nitrosospira sp.]|nr:hypothetical protein [Nitrosospira sp.]
MAQQFFTDPSERINQQIARGRSSPVPARFSHEGSPSPIFHLQRALGNRRVAELIQAKRLTPEGKIVRLQPKLTVGAVDDQYEQEADQVACQVISMPDAVSSNTATAQRAISPEEDKNEALQSKPLAISITPFAQRQIEINQESEEKEMTVQAKPVVETSNGSLLRQSVEEDDESAASSPRPSLQRTCATCYAGKEEKSASDPNEQ